MTGLAATKKGSRRRAAPRMRPAWAWQPVCAVMRLAWQLVLDGAGCGHGGRLAPWWASRLAPVAQQATRAPTKRHVVQAVPGAVHHRQPLAGDQGRILARHAARAVGAEHHAREHLPKAQLLDHAVPCESRPRASPPVALPQIPHGQPHAQRRDGSAFPRILWAALPVQRVVQGLAIHRQPAVTRHAA